MGTSGAGRLGVGGARTGGGAYSEPTVSARTRIVSSARKRIVLSRTSVKKGHSFVVTATGFKAHQKVRIRLNNKTRWTGRADSRGIVTRTVTFKSNTKSGRRSVKVQYKSGKWHTGISTSIKYYK